MTLAKRLVVCLDVTDGRVVKGKKFVDLRDVGDPVELAERYEQEGADEIVFLDISATSDARRTMLGVARQAAERLSIPLTIGGGIRSVDDIASALRAGADKVSVNSAAIQSPALLSEAASRFGSQCVVASIDAKRRADDSWEVYVAGGRRSTGIDALEWARDAEQRGAGEVLLTSIDRDGTRIGYDLELTLAVTRAVKIPVIASGGAGSADDVVTVFRDASADAALVAGMLHDGEMTILAIKQHMARAGLSTRGIPIATTHT